MTMVVFVDDLGRAKPMATLATIMEVTWTVAEAVETAATATVAAARRRT